MFLRRELAAVLVAALSLSAMPGTRAESTPAASREVFDTVVELIRSGDADMRPVAMEKVRKGLKGEAFTRELAEKVLPELRKPEDQAALLAALADRGDPAALPGVVAVAKGQAAPAVLTAAIRGVSALGGADELPLLMSLLAADGAIGEAARGALVAIRASDVSARLVQALGDAQRPSSDRVALVGILAERREAAALPALVTAAVDADAAVRAAAMKALGTLGGPAEVPGLVAGVLKSQAGAERGDAERALVLVCTQNRDKESAAAAFLALFQVAEPATREALLPTLARVGGPAVMAIVNGLIANPDAAQRKLGLTALSRWPDATVKDQLLELVGKAADEEERRLLLGGLIRIAPLPDNGLDPAQKLALVEQTMKLCTRDEERSRLLERAAAIRTVETLRYVLPYVDQPALAEPACLSVVELAHHQKLRDGHKEEFVKALDKVLATTKNDEVAERANRYKIGKTWERKKKT